MSEVVVCKRIKCRDYLADDGDPAWCYWAGCPANVAMANCPKTAGTQDGRKECQSEEPITKIGKNKK